jgi:ASC-1-like (ASCH) protein
MKKHHDIKILPIYFDYVREGRKTFELRINDRDYQSADTVTLHEWEKDNYTGRKIKFEIGYVLKLNNFINTDSDHVVFSLLEYFE